MVDQISQDRFAPSRARPFALRAVGVQPDLPLATNAEDLADGGVAAVGRVVAGLAERGLLPPPQR